MGLIYLYIYNHHFQVIDDEDKIARAYDEPLVIFWTK